MLIIHAYKACLTLDTPEKHRNHILLKLRWRALHPEPSAFYSLHKIGRFYARLLPTTDDFIISPNDLCLLHKHRGLLSAEWDISIQVPVTQHVGLKIDRFSTFITCSAPKHIISSLEKAQRTKYNPALALRGPSHYMSNCRLDEKPLPPAELALYRQMSGIICNVADSAGCEIAYKASARAAHLNEPGI